jgi:uncharacterized membrane protein YcaP (DUF421 family)
MIHSIPMPEISLSRSFEVSLPLTPTDLQQPIALQSQRREYAIERAAWLVMVGLVVLGILQGFGGSVVRAGVIYLVMLILFRVAGKRTLSDVTTFDFVLLLIISESIQNGLTDPAPALQRSLLLVITLVSLNILFSVIKQRWPRVEHIAEGRPVLIFSRGKPHYDVMNKERVGEEDIMHAARSIHGLKSLDEIEFAILETSGGISVIPRKGSTR